MRKWAAVLGATLWMALPDSQALSEESQALPERCLTQQTASIHVQFSINGTDASALRRKFNAGIKDIQSLSAGIGVTKMTAGGLQYSIQPQVSIVPYNGPVRCLDCAEDFSVPAQERNASAVSYQLSGHVNFLMEPPSKGIELLKLLLKKNYPATLSFVEANKAAGQCRLNVSTGKWE